MPQKMSPVDEIIREAAKDAEIHLDLSRKVIKSFLKNIMRLTVEGKMIRFVGFGSFVAKKYQTTTARNPRTGELIQIPEMMRVRFTAGQDFRAALNPKQKPIKVLKEKPSSKAASSASKKPAPKK